MSYYDIFLLLVFFQLKHLLADYFWQGNYMLGKFKDKGWILPLSAHGGVHAVFTLLIVGVYTMNPFAAIGLALADFIIHILVDRAKVVSSRGLTTQNAKFWHMLGCDQFIHHMTHYLIIFCMIYIR